MSPQVALSLANIVREAFKNEAFSFQGRDVPAEERDRKTVELHSYTHTLQAFYDESTALSLEGLRGRRP